MPGWDNPYEYEPQQTNTVRFQAAARVMVEILDAGHRFGSDGTTDWFDQGNAPEPAYLIPRDKPPRQGEISVQPPSDSIRQHLAHIAFQNA